MLVRRSHTAVVDYWEQILMIVAANVENDKEVELRMDMLSLLEHILKQDELHSTVQFYSEIILKMIIMPSMVWKPGKPSVSIRKGAIVCLIKLIEQKLIEPEKLHESYQPLLKLMKNCLDDDYVNDIRFAAVVGCKHIVGYIGHLFEEDDHKEMYTELLKRLDDSQDGIRIQTCLVFELFFDTLPDEWSKSLYEYTIKSIFVHIDD